MAIIEGILTNGVTEILKKLVLIISQEINLAWGVKDELKNLQDTLEMILAVLADAEKRQVTEEVVRLWLRRLKDVAYDADDVMDEFSYETMRMRVRGNNLKHKARDFVSSANPLGFHYQMSRKIKHINQRLDAITKDMSSFHLQTTPASSILPEEITEHRSQQTASSVNESDIIGREDEKERIINMLTEVIPSSSGSNPEKVSVISIVGMGGLGKTSLAQLVYKDELVNKHFELKIWVHVSEDFDVEKLLTKIMESSTQNKFDTLSNFDVLVNKVREQLNGKRYLLVLDDLWNEISEKWERLCSPLLVGAEGSKILVTTRKTQVANVVKLSIPPYKLEKLQDDTCWSIIERKAFGPGGALKTTNMTRIGREIARKCSGLPLAAKFLGGLMRSRNEEGNWLSIQENDIWNTPESQSNIMPILKLSYDNLSPELKQCFSYCSIFPKDWEISRVELVQLWIAEGFLNACKVGNGKSIEDVANEYFESLIWSSFLDGVQKNLLDDIKTCKMHDLVHDLAQAVFGDQELASLKVSELNHISKIRRLQLISDVDLSLSTFLKRLSNAKKLRTLFIPQSSNLMDPFILFENNHLRVLHVGSGLANYSARPKWRSLGMLKHLRYLRLTSLDLREVKNDQSINKLYNLETLVLNNMGIGVQILLRNIQALQKLRYLEVSFTDMVELPDSVTSLFNLQTLDLKNCELKVIPDSISGLKNLRFLNLSFNPIEELPASVATLSNLQTLDVNTCRNLKALPEFVAGLSNLRIFGFKNCPLLKALPGDIGALTQLRSLDLEGTQVEVLPESCANLINLEFLYLFNCELPKDVKNWTKLRIFMYNWRSYGPMILGVGKLVRVKKLTYSVPAKLINEAERSNVHGIEELGSLNFLEMLAIINLRNVKDPTDAARANLKGKQNLCQLILSWNETEDEEDESGMMSWDKKQLNNLRVFEALQPPTSLRYLMIRNFMGSDFPKWMCALPSGTLPHLDMLVLDNCKGIKQLPAEAIRQLPRLRFLELGGMSLKSLDIGGFPSLVQLKLTDMFFLEELCDSFPSYLQDLRISGCKSLAKIPSFPCLLYLELKKVDPKLVCSVVQTSLTQLFLVNIEELIYFPTSILQNNRNLLVLVIDGCKQFEGFGENDDGNDENVVATFGSLQKLRFYDSPVLKHLPPNLRGWTSLQTLVIFNCPQVKEFLTYDLKSLSFLHYLFVDFIQRDEQRGGDPSSIDNLINLMKN